MVHLIKERHVPDNIELDKLQQSWLYKILQDVIKLPAAKAVITAHLDNMNTRQIWAELCDTLDDRITAELQAQQLSTYLTSTRLKDGNWRGTHELFILHFKEQIRLHNEIVDEEDEKFTEGQSIKLLHSAVTGIDHLAIVLNTWRTSLKASFSKKKLNFHEYVTLL